MDNTTGIVLENTSLVADICGANDYNLRIMEHLLGGRILCRGNELFCESADPGIRTLFTSLVNSLLQSIEDGLPATPDLIIALHADLTPDGSEKRSTDEFLDLCIQIPGGFSKVFPRSKTQSLYLKGLSTHDPMDRKADDAAISKALESLKVEGFDDASGEASGEGRGGPLLFDGIGLCFPDVVVRNKIVGGEVYKTRGIRNNPGLDYE